MEEGVVLDRVHKLLGLAENAARRNSAPLEVEPEKRVSVARSAGPAQAPLSSFNSNYDLDLILADITGGRDKTSVVYASASPKKRMSPSPSLRPSPSPMGEVNKLLVATSTSMRTSTDTRDLAHRICTSEDSLARAEAETSMLRQALSAQEKTIANLQSDSEMRESVLERERVDHEKRMQDLVKSNTDLEARVSEVHASLSTQTSQLRSSLAAAESAVAQKDSELRDMHRKMLQLEGVCDGAQATHHSEMQQLRRANTDLSSTVDYLTASMKAAEADNATQCAALRGIAEEMGLPHGEDVVEALRCCLVSSKSRMQGLEKELASLQQRIASLHTEDKALAARLAESEKHLSSELDATTRLKHEILQLEMEKNEMSSRSVKEMNANTALVAEMKDQITELSSRLQRATLHESYVPSEMSPASALRRAEDQLMVLGSEKLVMSQEIHRLKQQNMRLSGDSDTSSANLATKLASAIAERNHAEEQLTVAKRELRQRDEVPITAVSPPALAALSDAAALRPDLAAEIAAVQEEARIREMQRVLQDNTALRMEATELRMSAAAAAEASSISRAEKFTTADELQAIQRLYSAAQEDLGIVKSQLRIEGERALQFEERANAAERAASLAVPPSFDAAAADSEMRMLRETLARLTEVVHQQEATFHRKVSESERLRAEAIQAECLARESLAGANTRLSLLEEEASRARLREAHMTERMQRNEVDHQEQLRQIQAMSADRMANCEALLRVKGEEVQALKHIAHTVAAEASESKRLAHEASTTLATDQLLLGGMKQQAEAVANETARAFEEQLMDALGRLHATQQALVESNQKLAAAQGQLRFTMEAPPQQPVSTVVSDSVRLSDVLSSNSVLLRAVWDVSRMLSSAKDTITASLQQVSVSSNSLISTSHANATAAENALRTALTSVAQARQLAQEAAAAQQHPP